VAGTATVAAPFSVVSGGSFNLVGAGATATVTVRFTPVTGLITATNVTFTANGGSMSRGVTGTGLVGTNPAPVLTSGVADDCHRRRRGLDADGQRQQLRGRQHPAVERRRAYDDVRERDPADGDDRGGGHRDGRLSVGHRGQPRSPGLKRPALHDHGGAVADGVDHQPREGATVGGSMPVGMSESNGTGTITWTLRLDGGVTPIFTTSGTATTASFNWDTTGLAPGAHQLQLTVQDGAGRTATATRNVTVGSPGTITVFITQPGTDGTTVSGTVWFTICWKMRPARGR